MDGGYNGGLLVVTSNSYITVTEQHSPMWLMHVARKCNYILSTYFAQQKHCQDLSVPNGALYLSTHRWC